jgi:diapolycopene oxygenase
MDELGIKINLNAEVSEVRREAPRHRPRGERKFHAADIIVSNMEVIPAYEKLLREDKPFIASLEKKYEPACSGLVLDLGLDCQYPQLAHHNFFFSGHQREHFHTVFKNANCPRPDDLSRRRVQDRPDRRAAGCDCLKILPHIPLH